MVAGRRAWRERAGGGRARVIPVVAKPCERCGGRGRTPRTQRRLVDGSKDRVDLIGQFAELCDRCSGAGIDPPQSMPEPKARRGYAADLIDF